jgi:hypothetical protein
MIRPCRLRGNWGPSESRRPGDHGAINQPELAQNHTRQPQPCLGDPSSRSSQLTCTGVVQSSCSSPPVSPLSGFRHLCHTATAHQQRRRLRLHTVYAAPSVLVCNHSGGPLQSHPGPPISHSIVQHLSCPDSASPVELIGESGVDEEVGQRLLPRPVRVRVVPAWRGAPAFCCQQA